MGVGVPCWVGVPATVSWYSVAHCHVMVDAAVMVKLVLAVDPEEGTDPDPVHPVQTYCTPVPPATGVFTEQFTVLPDWYQCPLP